MYVEAVQDLVKTLQAKPDEWQAARSAPPAPAATGTAGESVDDILKRITR